MIKKYRVLMVIVSMFILVACGSDDGLLQSPHKETEFLLGTVVSISIYDEDKEDVLALAFERVEALEDKISGELIDSEITEINNQAGVAPVHVSDEVYKLIEAGKQYSEESDGAFDISIGKLTSLWRIGYDDARKPAQKEIDHVLEFVDYDKVSLNEQEQTVFLTKEGMQLDLGAIAKGYITDEVNEILKDNEVTTAIIDLGGNIYVKGNRPSGEKWNVGIQNPFLARGELVGRIKVANQSIVTSGIYERFLEVDGEHYHHLLNPNDGYPFDNEIAGVTIVSEKSIDGDALSTVIFAYGLAEGVAYIEEIEGVESIFITKDREVKLTSGLLDNFELVNDDFELID